MSIAYLISWTGTAKPADLQIETFKNRTDAVGKQAIVEHKSLDTTCKAIGEMKDLEGVGVSFLVALYNAVTGESQKGFHDASTGRKKVWEALTAKYPDPDPVQPAQANENHEGETSANGGSTEAGVTDMASKTAKKAKTAKTAKTPKAPKEKKGPGVIDTIVTLLEGKGGTIADLAEKLASKFPDKDADGLKSTLKIQVNRLSKPKTEGGRGLKIKREKMEGTNELFYSL